MNSSILALLALCSLVACAPTSFPRDQPVNIQQGFWRIQDDHFLTQNEKNQQLQQWAQSNNLETQYADFRQKNEQMVQQMSQNATRIIRNLPTVQTRLENIFKNDNQNEQQRDEVIQSLKSQYPEEVPIIFNIWKVEKKMMK